MAAAVVAVGVAVGAAEMVRDRRQPAKFPHLATKMDFCPAA